MAGNEKLALAVSFVKWFAHNPIITLEFKYMLQSRLSFVIYGNDFIGGTSYFESRFWENYLPDVVGGIIFTDPYFQQLASTCGREHLNMVKSGYGLNIDHWSQFYFMAPSLLLALPSHLDPGQKREKMWWRTENCRKNGGKIFSITFLLLMWLVCNGGEA